jgi:hypothetical protein
MEGEEGRKDIKKEAMEGGTKQTIKGVKEGRTKNEGRISRKEQWKEGRKERTNEQRNEQRKEGSKRTPS